MGTLRDELVRLANERPGLRRHLVPLLRRAGLEWDKNWEGMHSKSQIPPKGMYVALQSAVNPDFPTWDSEGNYEYNKRRGTEFVRVRDLQEASKVSQGYIRGHDLGGGNWTGGQVYRDGIMVAYISYNGRVWPRPSK